MCDLPPLAPAYPRPCRGCIQKSPPFLVHQVALIFRPTPYHRLGQLSSFPPPKLLSRLRYGAIHIITKTPRYDPINCLHPGQHCISMESSATRTPPTPDNLPAAETCATSTHHTLRRSAPPSPSPSLERKPALSTGAMAYTIAIQRRIPQHRGIIPMS